MMKLKSLIIKITTADVIKQKNKKPESEQSEYESKQDLKVPKDFRSMLEFIDLRSKREIAIDRIKKDTEENAADNFKNLFLLNQINSKLFSKKVSKSVILEYNFRSTNFASYL